MEDFSLKDFFDECYALGLSRSEAQELFRRRISEKEFSRDFKEVNVWPTEK